jgi:hypothetical protein
LSASTSEIRDGGINNQNGEKNTIESFFEVWTGGQPLEVMSSMFGKMRAMLAGFMDFVQRLIDGPFPRHIDWTDSQ